MRLMISIGVGMVLGYLWYRVVGCSTGACPITSNPWISTAYGGFVGFVAGQTGG